MKNEDMPANPQSFSMTGIDADCGTMMTHYEGYEAIKNMGETKFEKAFWQVYSAIISSPTTSADMLFPDIATIAVSAVNDGFKALESLKEST